MNILICSAGRRVKLVSYFKEELSKVEGKVIAVDCDLSAPALYFADAYEIVPRIDHVDYIPVLMEICKMHNIDALLSLIDPELMVLAEHREAFGKVGVKLILSNKDIIEICFDKYKTYQFLIGNDLPAVPTFLDLGTVQSAIDKAELSFPLIVKPRKGSASIGIQQVDSLRELELLLEKHANLVVQPLIQGNEYGVDCYIDLINNKITNIFAKRKIKMRAGETDKSQAVNDPELVKLIQRLVHFLEPTGPIDIDCFKTEKGYMISEINPRFGGGYIHAHELGQNFPNKIINNLKGIQNEPNIGNYPEGSLLVKYDNHKLIDILR